MTLPRSTADDPARPEPRAPVWWGAYDVEQHQTRRWEVGPLVLLVERRVAEWRGVLMSVASEHPRALEHPAPRRALTGGAVAIGQPATVEGSRDPAA